ncbi:MAG: transcriptional regulator BetI [Rhizobiales bacterium]|nr:transcriptional regulator BetI [Hyphomicrobiales bacterium]
MARPSVEPIRRRDLMNAAIAAIHQRGSLDVTMSEIAGFAGVSPALAHHYFGGKDQLIVASMRHLLTELRTAVILALDAAETPRERISAVINTSFAPEQFDEKTVSAWLTFYHYAQSSDDAARLLTVYFARLKSNLADALRQLAGPDDAFMIAAGAAALIDGLYLRYGLKAGAPPRGHARALVERFIDDALAAAGGTGAV